MTNIPSPAWDTVSIDHGGPYPDGHYNFVLIDKRTRYPVVEPVPSTNFQANKERLKHTTDVILGNNLGTGHYLCRGGGGREKKRGGGSRGG